jgi:hypothetical protein
MTARLSDLSPEAAAKLRAQSAEYRERNREKRRAYASALHSRKYQEDPEYRARKNRSAQEAKLRRMYGMGSEGIQAKLEAQGFKCAICETDIRTKFHTDHCHTTGKVRDMLCVSCNVFLGKIETDPDRLAKALVYLEKHKNG